MQFLLDRHRLNVALSRAHEAVIVLGHRQALSPRRGGPVHALIQEGENVLPFVSDTQSDEDLLLLLLQDSEPWSWQRSQPLSRFAEVACLAKILNVPASMFLPLADKHSFQMQDQLDNVDLATFIGGVMRKC